MTPAIVLAQMIEELAPEDQRKVAAFIYELRLKEQGYPGPTLDEKYREYILEGIRQGEEDIAKEKYYTTEEARKFLADSLKK